MLTVSNITTLLLDLCENLVEIHDSVRYLGKLVTLCAYGCSMPKRFPQKVKLMSLEYIGLRGCCKLQRFPDVLEKMENCLFIDISCTDIKELPSLIENLSALQLLKLNISERARNLASSIAMLTNLTSISIRTSPRAVKYYKISHDFRKLKYYFLKKLQLLGCGVLDEELPTIVRCFPNLEMPCSFK